jgi:hypothetical protein
MLNLTEPLPMTCSQKNITTALPRKPTRYGALYCRVARRLGVSRQMVARVAAGKAASKRILQALIQELTDLGGSAGAGPAPSCRAVATSGTPPFGARVPASALPAGPCLDTEIELQARRGRSRPQLTSPPQAAPHGAPTFAALSKCGATSLPAEAS